jgi:hypothetical protein
MATIERFKVYTSVSTHQIAWQINTFTLLLYKEEKLKIDYQLVSLK